MILSIYNRYHMREKVYKGSRSTTHPQRPTESEISSRRLRSRSDGVKTNTLKCFYWPRVDADCPCINCTLQKVDSDRNKSRAEDEVIVRHTSLKIKRSSPRRVGAFTKVRQNLISPFSIRRSF